MTKVLKNDAQWVHSTHNFTWSLPHCNIHEIQIMDLLHQLYKGTIAYLVLWIIRLVDYNYPLRRGDVQAHNGPTARIDARMQQMPRMYHLKHFNNFRDVKQWSGEEQKAMHRLLLSAFAPFLEYNPRQTRFIRAAVTFVLLAHLHYHNEDTIRLMEQQLAMMDVEKTSFADFRNSSGKRQETFNYSKWHILVHYTSYIALYGALDGYNTSQTEACHKFQIKCFIPSTNGID